MCQNDIFTIMLIIAYGKQEKNDGKRQKLVFECAQCGKILDEASTVFFASSLFRSARDKDKALLKFITILNDMGDEVTKNTSSFDNLKDFLCFCKE